ncbi:helix-turn-helix transcriptional regulator [Natrinema salinisoli]|uniref:helix-turn-helix transcriptional regulator n=1 Tax=Natrinema salinisoli TaxID=2878535 RepID=UPI001CF09904|nr:transcriptional regulator [Natrinema salinisoli]
MSDRNGLAIETLEYVSRSQNRVRILETLSAEGAVSRESLMAETGVVRTTLQRNLIGLAERGLIRERDQRYELTSAGSLAAAGLSTALERIGAAVRLRPVLERLPADALGFDPNRLADAAVVESTPANPYGPVERHVAALPGVEHARLALPATGANQLEQSRRAIDSGAVFEVVVTEGVAETVRTDPLVSDSFAAIADTDSMTVSVAEDGISFYLGILDETVQIAVYDENGVPTALLESTDERVREWAVDRFDTLERRSEPIEVAE